MWIASSAKMSEKHQQRLKQRFPHHSFAFYDNMQSMDTETFENVEILATYGEDLSPQMVEQMPELKWIQVLSAGLDEMPFSVLKERGVLVTNARGIHRIPMAEYTLGMILDLVRRSHAFYDLQKEGKWDRSVRVSEAYGKTVGIIGLGAIGTEIARRAQAFGMNVIGLKKKPVSAVDFVDEVVGLDQLSHLMAVSDFVIVLLPLTAETERLIDRTQLEQMKSTAYLLNISRGPVIDEQALLEHVRQKRIAGAVLDVFSEEPLPADHPLWKEENIIITPHVSGRSPQYMKRAVDIFEQNLTQYPQESKMVNVIDLTRHY